ncbi:beta-glucosidase 13-like [Malania oleifera]|uniref:beta-glucosidase 13-like n=1 Tax=Malania oleifera TaxID=397392 RepID=UPI0025AE6444|nr:beta-glucosidase 13-like [Malania oleifera]
MACIWMQTESLPNEGGRGSSTWDSFIGDTPAVNSLELYKEDVQCLKNMKADVYRFSIAWPRLLPKGKLSEGINQEGIDFYNNLINELIANGIEPFVTLFHFDLPTVLQDEYNGFLGTEFVEDYKNYADLCFKTFGDRVKHWITFNEPEVFSAYGYRSGLTPPDDRAKNPYIAAHHLLLAHANAAKVYRENYQDTQGGEIGLSLGAQWYLPLTDDSPQDKDGASRAWDFMVGWFLDPLVTGDYPFSMKAIVRDRLPEFSESEKALLKGAFDFVGINYYTSSYVKALPISPNDVPTDYQADTYVQTSSEKDGIPIGPKAEGYPEKRDDTIPIVKALQDDVRISWIQDHLASIKEALSGGVNVNGYFAWALMDCMEMAQLYTVRFGLNYTDYLNDYARYPKKSAFWLSNFLTASDTATAAATADTTTASVSTNGTATATATATAA